MEQSSLPIPESGLTIPGDWEMLLHTRELIERLQAAEEAYGMPFACTNQGKQEVEQRHPQGA